VNPADAQFIDSLLTPMRVAARNGGVVAIEGSNGAGKSTLIGKIRERAEQTGIRLHVAPPGPRPASAADVLDPTSPLQRASEKYLVEQYDKWVYSMCSYPVDHRPVLLFDRGWVTIEVFRALFGRPGPVEGSSYHRTFLPAGPPLGLVIFLECGEENRMRVLFQRDDEVVPEDVLRREADAWRVARTLYAGAKLTVERTREGYTYVRDTVFPAGG
jgi:hypothetical protein